MTAHVMPDLKVRLKTYGLKFVEYSWDVSLVVTFAFAAIILLIFVYGLAINYNIINPPQLLCHDMVGDPHAMDICK